MPDLPDASISGPTPMGYVAFEVLLAELADPYWEGIAGRGLGLVAAARGDAQCATAILLDTLQRCSRLPDAYVWDSAYVLDSLYVLAIAQRNDLAPTWVGQLVEISARTGMRELVARSHWHHALLGQPGAAETSRFLANEIGNPVLDATLV